MTVRTCPIYNELDADCRWARFTYTYDQAGQLASITSSAETNILLFFMLAESAPGWDASGCLLSMRYPESGSSRPSPTPTPLGTSQGGSTPRAWHDPSLGRFLNRDPIGFNGGLNLYGYVGQNPTNYVDPMGLAYNVTILAYAGLPGHTWLQVRSDSSDTGFNVGLFPSGTVFEDYANGVFTDSGGPRSYSINADHQADASLTVTITDQQYKKLKDWAIQARPYTGLSNCSSDSEEGMGVIGKRLPRDWVYSLSLTTLLGLLDTPGQVIANIRLAQLIQNPPTQSQLQSLIRQLQPGGLYNGPKI